MSSEARQRYEREKWLLEDRPTIHREQLHAEFVPMPDKGGRWVAQPLSYVLCKSWESALPAIPPKRLFYSSSCACGNLRWRRLFERGRLLVRDQSKALPIGLFGGANPSFQATASGGA